VWHAPKIDVDVDHTTMKIATDGTVMIRVKAEGARIADITATQWSLPGLMVKVAGDTTGFAVKESSYYAPGDSFEIKYASMRTLTLTVTPQ
jgi:hypothetical protein